MKHFSWTLNRPYQGGGPIWALEFKVDPSIQGTQYELVFKTIAMEMIVGILEVGPGTLSRGYSINRLPSVVWSHLDQPAHEIQGDMKLGVSIYERRCSEGHSENPLVYSMNLQYTNKSSAFDTC